VATSGYAGPERRKSRRPPDDACPTCGTIMRPHRGTRTLPVNGEPMRVPGISYLLCPKCGETLTNYEQVGYLFDRAHQLYREKHHLLSPSEIEEIRERHGLTQAALAKLLRLGANTISRWESDRMVQTAAMDVLLRLIRDVPETLRFLRRHAA
jgi:putative zinc finger/helix-turn-helix YgiT family protein